MTNDTRWDVNAPWLRAHSMLGDLSKPLDERVNKAYAILGEALASAPSAPQPTTKPRIPTLTDLIGTGDRVIEIDEDGVVHVPQEEPTQANRIKAAFRDGYDFGQADRRFDVTDANGAWLKSGTKQALEALSSSAPAIEQLSAELETERMRLVACMTASVQNTESSKTERLAPEHPYWSVAYSDVCRAVDREMTLRRQFADHLVQCPQAQAVAVAAAAPPDTCDDLCMIPVDPIAAAIDAQLDPLKDA